MSDPFRSRRLSAFAASVGARLAAGALTLAPLVVTVWALWFLINIVSTLGGVALQPIWPLLGIRRAEVEMFWQPWMVTGLELLVAALILFAVGSLAGSLVGAEFTRLMSRAFDRMPIARTIYGGVQKLIESFRREEDKAQKVVLIEFPSPEMKALGFVTRRFFAADTGQELAAVYVPTTPNPTSGYVEIVPVERLVWLDWTPDQAIQFIVSGGIIAPDSICYRPTPPPEKLAGGPGQAPGEPPNPAL